MAALAAASAANIGGSWTAYPAEDPGSVQIQLRREILIGGRDWIVVKTGDLLQEESSFRLVRGAGTLHFTGALKDRRGQGTFRFERNDSFRDALRLVAPDWWNDERLFAMTLRDVPIDYLKSLHASGYKAKSAFDILLRHPAQPPLLDATAENLARLRSFQVPSSYLHRLSESGYLLSSEEAQQLHFHNVSPDLLRQMKLSGRDNLSVSDMLKLQTHGVTSFDIQRLQANGHTNLSADDIVRLKNGGPENSTPPPSSQPHP